MGKDANLHESFQYPVTTYPLSIATAEKNLKQGQKSLLKNFLVSEADAVTETAPKHSRWIFDGMAIVRSLKAKKTYLEIVPSCCHAIHRAEASMCRSHQ